MLLEQDMPKSVKPKYELDDVSSCFFHIFQVSGFMYTKHQVSIESKTIIVYIKEMLIFYSIPIVVSWVLGNPGSC